MISEQPIDRLPRLADPYFRSGWLNAKTKGGRDFGPDGSDMAYVSTPIDERVGMTFDGVGDYLSRAEADWRSADSQGTISAWIKRDAAGVSHTIISSADTGSLLYYIQLTIFNDLLLFVQKDNDTLGSVLGSTTLAAGQ